MLKDTLSKGISIPIAIGIVLILVIIVGGFTWWQYGEMWKETSELLEIELPEKEDETIEVIEGKYEIINQSDGIKIKILSNILPKEFSEFKINGWMGTNQYIETISLDNGIVIHSISCCQGNQKSYDYFMYITNPEEELSDYIPILENTETCNMQTKEKRPITKPSLKLIEENGEHKVYSYEGTYSLDCAVSDSIKGGIIIWSEKGKNFLISQGKESGISGPTLIHNYFKSL